MRTSLTPYLSQSIGFTRILDELDRLSNVTPSKFPPRNIVDLGDGSYQIEMALAGFSRENIEITTERDFNNCVQLSISGEIAEEENPRKYLYQGIATRKFNERFKLAAHVEVTNAEMTDGVLVIKLKEVVPEELQPRQIEIQ